MKGTKKYVDGGKRISTKRNILWKEYISLKSLNKENNKTITRNRIICGYKGS